MKTGLAVHVLACCVAIGLALMLDGCKVGPNYSRPTAPLAPAFKEPVPENFKSNEWKTAQPADTQLKGDWWTLFNDDQLNTLEAQIDPAKPDAQAGRSELPGGACGDSLSSRRSRSNNRRCPNDWRSAGFKE